MPALQFATFLGQVPYLHPTGLPDNYATAAKDCWFVNGTLQPIKQALVDGTSAHGSSDTTLYRYRPCPTNPAQAYWIEMTASLNVAPSPIANDLYARTFFTRRDGQTAPYFTDVKTMLGGSSEVTLCGVSGVSGPYPKATYSLGLTAPGAPSAEITDNIAALGSSADGNTWSASQGLSTAGVTFNVVVYTNSLWLVGGNSGLLATSTDGITWAVATLPSEAGEPAIRGVAYGNGAYVAVCAGGKVLTSTDAASWTLLSADRIKSTGIDLYTVAYYNGNFWAAGAKGHAWQSNGVDFTKNWTAVDAVKTIFGARDIYCSVVGQEGTTTRLVLAGGNGRIATRATAGGDSTGWVDRSQGSTSFLGAAYNAGVFSLAGNKGYLASTTGRTWSGGNVSGLASLSAIVGAANLRGTGVSASGRRIFVGTNGVVAVETASQSNQFTAPTSAADFGSTQLNSVAYGGGRYVVAGVAPAGAADTRYYVVTFVDRYGAQSAPSAVSNQITVLANQPVSLKWDAGDVSGVNTTAAEYWLYRTSTSGSGTDFQFVAKVSYTGGQQTYTDNKEAAALGETLASTDWTKPPTTLRGLVSIPGGVLVGYVDNTLWFSEPGQPHAWPVKYQRVVDYPIVGLSVFGNSVLVATTGQPYLLQGVDPFNMVPTKLEAAEACVAEKSLVDLGDRVVYASASGLVSVSTSGVELLTKQIFTWDQWQQLQPATMRAYPWDGRYLVFFDGSGDFIPTGAHALVIVPGGQIDGAAFFTETARAGYYDLYEDSLYFLSGTSRKVWNLGSGLQTAVWRSKKQQTPAYTGFSWLQAQADGYPVTVRYYADDVLTAQVTWTAYTAATGLYAYTVTPYRNGVAQTPVSSSSSQSAVRLPAGRRAQFHQVEIESSAVVRAVTLAQHSEELRKL